MLSNTEAIATVAVRDLKTAAEFYEGKLGLKEASREGEDLIGYRCGNSVLNVYRSEYAGTSGYDRIYDGYPDVALDMVASRTFDGKLQLLEYVPLVLGGPPGTHPGSWRVSLWETHRE